MLQSRVRLVQSSRLSLGYYTINSLMALASRIHVSARVFGLSRTVNRELVFPTVFSRLYARDPLRLRRSQLWALDYGARPILQRTISLFEE